MFIDEIYTTMKAGSGGTGRASFFPGRKTSPDGGNGGRGGDIYVVGVTNMSSLSRYAGTKIFRAEDGTQGMGFRRHGVHGKELLLEFPVGTTFVNQETRESVELLMPNQKILLCKGGRGGRGNNEFKSSVNISPRQFEPGEEGQEKKFQIVMKLIAEYGFIGLPNAGKSSLLNELTRAHVKTAPYPFTTVEPNLGSIDGRILADIPGLIEGASKGKGLGIKFLRHIEKVKVLLHCISSESDDVMRDYEIVRKELSEYNDKLSEKDEIILLTKHDLLSKKQVTEKLKQLKKLSTVVLPISIHDWDSLQELRKKLR